MKRKIYLLLLGATMVFAFSCKKDNGGGTSPTQPPPKNHTLEKGLVTFSAEGELVPSVIDTTSNTVTITMPNGADLHSVKASFLLADQVNATVNNTAISSGAGIDLSQPLTITVTSADKTRSTTFTLVLQTELQYFGIGGNITTEKSQNKDYSFYIDQFDGSTLQAINCGPTVTTMAIKWADQSYTGTPLQARTDIYANGDWWFTTDISTYLDQHGVNNTTVMISDFDNLIKSSIDNNKLVILCLDMYSFIDYNNKDYQHTNKFYQTLNAGWGHFLLVKGYKQTTTGLYLEVYDPYTNH